MSTIILYDKSNVTVSLNRLFFDPEIEGVQAELEVQNRKDVYINVLISDLWDGKRFYDDYTIISRVSPRKTLLITMIELSETDEEERIMQFQKGYLPNFSFRISVYSRYHDTDTLQFCGKGDEITISKFSMNGVSVEPCEYFDITYIDDTLFAAAKHYIPFEINKSNLEKAKQICSFKEKLSNRIKAIELFSDSVLVAQYGELGKPRFYDIENMCIYNLGASTFSQCCPNDIAFMELTEQQITSLKSSIHESCDRNYFYAYTPMWRNELDTLWQSKSILAQWKEINIDMLIQNTPLRYWKSIREQHDKIDIHPHSIPSTTSTYGLRLIMHTPTKVFPASIMKPLLDGVVCAFHKRKKDHILQKVTDNSFDSLVTIPEENISLLGEQDYLQPYRESSVKWNPADERLKFAWISIVVENCSPHLEGTLFHW